jgi:hypothetical protein
MMTIRMMREALVFTKNHFPAATLGANVAGRQFEPHFG